jgi:uncharacterized protein
MSRLLSRVGMIRIAAAAALLAAVPAPAQTPSCTAPLPAARGAVNDFANVMADSTEARLTAIIQQVREESGGEILVVTLESLHGCTEMGIADQIGREWHNRAVSSGDDPSSRIAFLVLVVPSERLAGIPARRNEGFITREELGRILNGSMIPAFQAGDFDAGISAGVLELARRFADRFGFTLQAAPPE